MKSYNSVIKCDLHMHSRFSDGKLTIAELVDLYGNHGFGAIAITDHLCESENIIGKVSHSMNYSLTRESFPQYLETLKKETARAWREYEMLVIPGFEITKNSFLNKRSAHFLVLGIEEYLDPELPVPELLKLAKAKNAFTIAAHPFPTGEIEFQTLHLWLNRETYKHHIDAWEVNCRKKICDEVLKSGLPLIANSDLHLESHFSSWKTKIKAEKQQSSIFEAIKNQDIDFFLDAPVNSKVQQPQSLKLKAHFQLNSNFVAPI